MPLNLTRQFEVVFHFMAGPSSPYPILKIQTGGYAWQNHAGHFIYAWVKMNQNQVSKLRQDAFALPWKEV